MQNKNRRARRKRLGLLPAVAPARLHLRRSFLPRLVVRVGPLDDAGSGGVVWTIASHAAGLSTGSWIPTSRRRVNLYVPPLSVPPFPGSS